MKIERHTLGTVEVLTPYGPLTAQDAEAFAALLRHRTAHPNPRVVVSLQEVPYLDSRAIEGLLEASDELADRALNLKLAAVAPVCREVLELTGVANRLAFFEDVHAAVRSFL